ncbi:MAG: cation diffusion facilitator family transporter [Clostridiales bacterium]|nr:cation diffusion facilitator family transporter [Clostridiales bacterium]
MQNWLIKKLIKDSDNIQDLNVRAAYGKLSGKVGIFCNVVLFIGKFLAGTISGSVSITADAVNNLSDAASSIVSLVGFKLAERPADEEHPYGHARFEYLSGLTVAVMIIVIGIELFKTGLDKVLNPSPVDFSLLTITVLIISILVKLWMAVFNRSLGKKINSSTLEATAADSRNDVISTGAVLAAAVISEYFDIQLDGYMGIAVAVFVLISGIGLVRETLDPLLGKAPDPALVDYIRKKILSYDGVLGTHDLMVHDYGPGRQFASVHVEMAAEEDVLKSHDVIDDIERDFLNQDKINLIVHYDPIVTEGNGIDDLRGWLMEQVKSIDRRLSIHDLRVVKGNTKTKLVFDCVKPAFFHLSETELKNQICELVSKKYPLYYCVITIDTSYAAMPHSQD